MILIQNLSKIDYKQTVPKWAEKFRQEIFGSVKKTLPISHFESQCFMSLIANFLFSSYSVVTWKSVLILVFEKNAHLKNSGFFYDFDLIFFYDLRFFYDFSMKKSFGFMIFLWLWCFKKAHLRDTQYLWYSEIISTDFRVTTLYFPEHGISGDSGRRMYFPGNVIFDINGSWAPFCIICSATTRISWNYNVTQYCFFPGFVIPGFFIPGDFVFQDCFFVHVPYVDSQKPTWGRFATIFDGFNTKGICISTFFALVLPLTSNRLPRLGHLQYLWSTTKLRTSKNRKPQKYFVNKNVEVWKGRKCICQYSRLKSMLFRKSCN